MVQLAHLREMQVFNFIKNKMGAVITYEDNAGTNALNTDIVLQKLSADNGSNYYDCYSYSFT